MLHKNNKVSQQVNDILWKDFKLLLQSLTPIIEEDVFQLLKRDGAKLIDVFNQCAQSEDHELNLMVGHLIARMSLKNPSETLSAFPCFILAILNKTELVENNVNSFPLHRFYPFLPLTVSGSKLERPLLTP